MDDRGVSGKPRNTFIRSVGVLMSGTVLAHAITALALPVLSRLYSPADFSALATFTGLMSIVAVAACLRFDIAVPIPDNDADAVNILALALTSALSVAALIAVPCIFASKQMAELLNQPVLQGYLWLLPIGVLLASGFSVLQNWHVRKKQFRLISYSRICQSSASLGLQVGMGVGGVAPLGLLVGYIMNTGAACIFLGYRFLRSEGEMLRSITRCRMREMFAVYHRFPKYSAIESLGNSAAIQLPIIMIAAMAVGPEAGYLTMAMYVMQAPMALIGTAVAQVYLSRAPEEYRSGTLGDFTADIFGGLLKAGVGPLLFAGIVSPVVFSIIFGEEWRRAGQMVVWMTPWFIMQFIASPISMALHVLGHQKTALWLQIFGLATRVGAVWVAGSIAVSWVTEAYAFSGFIIYLVYVIVVLRALSIRSDQIWQGVFKSFPHALIWIVFGFGVVIVCNVFHGRV